MTPVLSSLAVGIFRDRTRARQAVEELRQAGFYDDQIDVQSDWVARPTFSAPALVPSALTCDPAEVCLGGLLGGTITAVLIGAVPGTQPLISLAVLPAIPLGIFAGLLLALLVRPFGSPLLPWGESRPTPRPQQRTIVRVEAGERSEEARAILRRHGAWLQNPALNAHARQQHVR